MISMSYSAPSALATCRASVTSRLDPQGLILPARYDVAARGDFSQGGKVGNHRNPLVPMTCCHPGLSGAAQPAPRSASGAVKSMTHVAGRKGCVKCHRSRPRPRAAPPHGLPKVLPDPAMPGTLDRSRKHRAGLFVRRLNQHPAPCAPRHQKPQSSACADPFPRNLPAT